MKHPRTLRTFQPNRMAAALSNLNTLSVDSEQENYACCFLDRVNSKQQFNAEVLKALNLACNVTLKNFYNKNQWENTTFRPDVGRCQVNDVIFKSKCSVSKLVNWTDELIFFFDCLTIIP